MLEEKTLILQFSLFVEKDENVYYAHSPTFKGLHVEGDTEAEAIENAKEAAMAYIESLIKHQEPLPLCTVRPEIKNADRIHEVVENIYLPAFA